MLDAAIAATPALAKAAPSDIEDFCPKYYALQPGQRNRFWRELLLAIVVPESHFKPAEAYWEIPEGKVWTDGYFSAGLFQLSSSDGSDYKCAFSDEYELIDAQKNIFCGVRILARWVAPIDRTGKIGGIPYYKPKSDKPHYDGAARYWSTLRAARDHSGHDPRTAIRAATAAVSGCM